MIDNTPHLNAKESLGEEIATLAVRIDAATHELLVLIRKFDEQEGWSDSFLNCAQWLTWRIGLAPSAAREKVRVARALAELPLMSEAMKHGRLSYSKVRALTRVARPDTEKSLVDLGRAATAAHIERVVRAWRRVDRTLEPHDDELREAASHVVTHIDENGMFVIRGRLAPEVGEVLVKALDAASEKLYDESRTEKENADRPPAGKLRADALGLVAESALASGLDSGSSGDRYQVVVHVNEADLRSDGETPSANSAGPRVSAEAYSGDVPARSATGQGARNGVSAEAPSRNGAWLGDSHIPVSAETARRIASDAGRIRMTHRNGEILSVGRKTRTIPPPVRRALEFRDGGCRFPACTSRHCDAHHIHHWDDGGETKLSNLVLLCRRHHRLLHEGGFDVRMGAGGTVQFFHPSGRPLHESPEPPPFGPYPCDDLLRDLGDAGIVVTGKESLPAWDGTPMDLRYVMECLWKPPPHLQDVVDRERLLRATVNLPFVATEDCTADGLR